MSTRGPKLLNDARASLMEVAPTVMTASARAGLWLVAWVAALPAETAT